MTRRPARGPAAEVAGSPRRRPPRSGPAGASGADLLFDEDRPSGARRVAERLGEEPAAIRGACGENARRAADGLRPVFLTHHDGTIGLTEGPSATAT
ncbi:MAG: hypothetical protein R3F43_06380 [bacterium]